MEELNNTRSFGLLLGNEKHLPWSHSKAEVAKTCMYKFSRVYLDGERESSPSLLLGSFAHETLETLLRAPEAPTVENATDILLQIKNNYVEEGDKEQAYYEVIPMLPYIVDFVIKWKNFIKDKNIKHWRVESAFGLTEDRHRATYEPGPYRTYIRGRIDLWAYDAQTKTLYVIDHKTNKNAESPKKVKENLQLNLYITFLSNVYKLEWKEAYYGLNFLRRKKIVWARTTPEENANFTDMYFNTLRVLEERILDCELDNYWPPEESYKCGMCSFKGDCPFIIQKQEENIAKVDECEV